MEPLDNGAREAVIVRALERRRAAAPPSPPRRLLRFLPLAGLVGVAAALALMVTQPDEARGLTLDLVPTRALERGMARAVVERPELSLRNEPDWTLRLGGSETSEALSLYLVAGTSDGSLSHLNVATEHKGNTFRIPGELGELGLQPGDVTLYFLVGPRDSDQTVLETVQCFRSGCRISDAWGVTQLDLRISE